MSNAKVRKTNNSNTQLVWYASYGSNMDTERFLFYINGGRPTHALTTHPGCSDKTLPLAEKSFMLPNQMYFAGEAPNWNGGMAFITHDTGERTTRSKAYLITLEQFEEVAAQESHRDKVNPVDLDQLRELGRLTLGDGSGNYDEAIYSGEMDGYPIVSFTNTNRRDDYAKPTLAYVTTILSGLMDSHDMTQSEAAEYLLEKPGVSGNYTLSELLGEESYLDLPFSQSRVNLTI